MRYLTRFLAIAVFATIIHGAFPAPVFAGAIIFNANITADNNTQRTAWLAAIGIAAPAHLVNFESGFADGQNIDGMGLGSGFFLDDTSSANAVTIECRPGTIGGSTPIGNCAAEHNEQAFLVFDFTSNPVDYVGFFDIDHTPGNGGRIFFVGGATQDITLDTTGSGPGFEEFYGIFRNDMPRIERVAIDIAGDGQWGVDNIEYGQEPAETPEPGPLVTLGLGLVLLCWRGKSAAGRR
jgi:hypothetical protein